MTEKKKSAQEVRRMLTYAHVCSRMLTYADVQRLKNQRKRMLTYADV